MSLRSRHRCHVSSTPLLAPVVSTILLALSLLACSLGGTTSTSSSGPPTSIPSTATATTPPLTQAMLRRVAASASVAASAHGPVSATASCPSGTTMLSGGYDLSGGPNVQTVQVLEDHPQTASSWKATAGTVAGGPFTLTVYADCLQAPFPLTTQIISTPNSVPTDGKFDEASAACPAGTLVTGGGYTSAVGTSSGPAVNASQPIIGVGTSPSARGWDIHILMTQDPFTPIVFAVCAAFPSFPSLAETAATAKQAITASSGTLSVNCPSGQLLAGGGFTLDAAGGTNAYGNAYANALDASGRQWTISAVASSSTAVNETAYAACL